LTDGYARALQLESERLRLERRIGELAHNFDGPEDADELKSLAGRLRDVDVELEGLLTGSAPSRGISQKSGPLRSYTIPLRTA